MKIHFRMFLTMTALIFLFGVFSVYAEQMMIKKPPVSTVQPGGAGAVKVSPPPPAAGNPSGSAQSLSVDMIKAMTKEQFEKLPDNQLLDYQGQKITKRELMQKVNAELDQQKKNVQTKLESFKNKASSAKVDINTMSSNIARQQRADFLAKHVHILPPPMSVRAKTVADIRREYEDMKQRYQTATAEGRAQIDQRANELRTQISYLDNGTAPRNYINNRAPQIRNH